MPNMVTYADRLNAKLFLSVIYQKAVTAKPVVVRLYLVISSKVLSSPPKL